MLRKAHILLFSAVFLVALGVLASRLYLRLLENQEQQRALYLASNTSQAIQQNLLVALSAAKALSPIIDDQGNVQGFDRIAPEIYASFDGVTSVQLAPRGIVEYVYPLEGNESVIGLNNFADEQRRDESVAVVKSGKLAVSGPLALKQGYTGVIGRYPIFRGEGKDNFDRFWGFATVIVSLEGLLEATQIEQLESDGYKLRLTLLRSGNQSDRAFYESVGFEEEQKTVSLSFHGVAKEWKLEIQHVDSWVPIGRVLVIIVIAFVIGALLLWIIALIINSRQAQTLQLEQMQKTQYLLAAANTLAELGSWEFDPTRQEFTLSPELAHMIDHDGALTGVQSDVFGSKLHPQRWRAFLVSIQTLLPGNDAVRETIHTQSGSTQTERVFEVHAMALQRPGTKSHTVVGYFRDITLREQTSQKLQQSLEQLEQANKAKDLLFTVVAHDLRGPAGSLHSIIEMLVEGNLSSKQIQEMKPMLHQSSRSIVNLLDNLLSWSLSQRGTITIAKTTLDVREIVAEVFGVVEYRAHLKGISLTSSIREDNYHMFTDATVLNTILRNLVSNAVKFTQKDGNVNVEFRTEANDDVISVSDTGIGMTPEQLNSAFKSEVMASTIGTHAEQGTGLGLRVCKDLIQKLGGTISVQSQQNAGTTFVLRFPKKDEMLLT